MSSLIAVNEQPSSSVDVSDIYNTALKDRFFLLSNGISAFAKKMNITVTPYYDSTLPYFSVLTSYEQTVVLNFLENVYETYCSVEQEGKDITDSKTVLWHSIKRLGLRPSSDLFNTLLDTDIIEIHTPSFQAFRNINFFKLCSYSIEELTSIHWTKLFYRDQKHSDAIMTAARTVFIEQTPVIGNVSQHVVEELSSANKFKVLYDLQGIYPLFETNGTGERYALVQIRAQLLSKS